MPKAPGADDIDVDDVVGEKDEKDRVSEVGEEKWVTHHNWTDLAVNPVCPQCSNTDTENFSLKTHINIGDDLPLMCRNCETDFLVESPSVWPSKPPETWDEKKAERVDTIVPVEIPSVEFETLSEVIEWQKGGQPGLGWWWVRHRSCPQCSTESVEKLTLQKPVIVGEHLSLECDSCERKFSAKWVWDPPGYY